MAGYCGLSKTVFAIFPENARHFGETRQSDFAEYRPLNNKNTCMSVLMLLITYNLSFYTILPLHVKERRIM